MSLPLDLAQEFQAQTRMLDDASLARHAEVGALCQCHECFCCIAWAEQNTRYTQRRLKNWYAQNNCHSDAD